jgi:hypothetical protein
VHLPDSEARAAAAWRQVWPAASLPSVLVAAAAGDGDDFEAAERAVGREVLLLRVLARGRGGRGECREEIEGEKLGRANEGEGGGRRSQRRREGRRDGGTEGRRDGGRKRERERREGRRDGGTEGGRKREGGREGGRER